jgi:GNAT superfamily N-acetyltransferase
MSGTIYIRHISVKDAVPVTALSLELGYSMTVNEMITNIAAVDKSNCDVAYVAILDEIVVGWIHVFYTIRLESGPFCEIGGLVVSKTVQGKGIGKQLVEKARKWAAERNINKLRVRCNVVRAGAHEFYVKSGFIENKQQKVFECIV